MAARIAGREATVSRALKFIVALMALIGGGALMSAALLVTFSVAMRWWGAGGVPGDFELVQIAVAVSVFVFLPWCQLKRGNIVVDTFTLGVPERINRGLDALWDAVFAAVAGLIAYCMTLGALEVRSYGETTMVQGIPLWPAVAVCAAIAGLLAVVAVFTALQRLRGRA